MSFSPDQTESIIVPIYCPCCKETCDIGLEINIHTKDVEIDIKQEE